MAQAGYTPIQLYFSTTAAAVPLAANLAQGELAINIADGKLYFENSSGVVTLLASSTTVTNSFSAGTTGFTPSTATTGAVTLGGTLITSNGGTGLSSYTAGDLTYYASGTTFTKLAIGTAGQFLTSSGTAPQWSTLSGVAVTTFQTSLGGLTPSTATSGAVTLAGTLNTSSGGTGLSSYTAGDLPYYAAGTLLSKLAIGAANRVLTSTGSAPQWVASLTGLTSVSATTFTENGYAVVSQADIGTADNEIPLNQYLGSMAYQNGTDYYNVGMTVGFRNRIINGAMVIDQRNAGASITPTDNQYSVDRWACRLNQASKYSAQQNAGSVTPPSGYTNYLGVTSLSSYSVASGDYFFLNQAIEGFNIVDLAWGTANAKSITLSFQIYSSLTGTFGASICNSGGTRVYPFSYTVSSANTWTSVSVTVAGDTTGTWLTTTGVGIAIRLGLGCGSTFSGGGGAWTSSNYVQPANTVSVVGTSGATFYITGVQLEKGNIATSFDVRPYGTEFALCQRYFESSYPLGTAVGSAVGTATFQTFGTAVYNVVVGAAWSGGYNFKVTKRAVPTLTLYDRNGTSGQWYWGVLGSSESSVATTADTLNVNNFFLITNAAIANSTGAYGYYAASSEL